MVECGRADETSGGPEDDGLPYPELMEVLDDLPHPVCEPVWQEELQSSVETVPVMASGLDEQNLVDVLDFDPCATCGLGTCECILE